MDPQNAVGAMQADKTVQLQTHPNYVSVALWQTLNAMGAVIQKIYFPKV